MSDDENAGDFDDGDFGGDDIEGEDIEEVEGEAEGENIQFKTCLLKRTILFLRRAGGCPSLWQ